MAYVKLLEIELFANLTVYKQMTDVWLNCQLYIKYLKPFNFVDSC